jgi:outer membrane lipoprotein-sorting protein
MPASFTVGIFRTNIGSSVVTTSTAPVDLGEYSLVGKVLRDPVTLDLILLKDNDLEPVFEAPAGGETPVDEIIIGNGSQFCSMVYDSTLNTVTLTPVNAQDYYSTLKLASTIAGTHVWELLRVGINNTITRVS